MRKNKLFLVMSILAITTLMFSIIAVSAMTTSATVNVKGISVNDGTTDNVLTAKTPQILDKIEFIHYKDGKVKVSVSVSKSSLPTCSAFLTSTKIKWNTLPINYIINPTNSYGLAENDVNDVISNSAETWDDAISKNLMNDAYEIDFTAKYGVRDYKNTISFGDYPRANVIAVTTIWYNSRAREIVEFDIMFDTNFTWGIDGSSNKMDLQNIATHELGHGVGLGDIYTKSCSIATMYGYSWNGDIQKRTLEAGDIRGLQTLYGK